MNSSLSASLIPVDGPMGEELGWRRFTLLRLQADLSPLLATLILTPLKGGWHVPLFFIEKCNLHPSIVVGGVLTTVAVTSWCTWRARSWYSWGDFRLIILWWFHRQDLGDPDLQLADL